MKILKFEYNENIIHYYIMNNSNVKVNATEIAAIFKKEVKDFINLQSTKDYIKSYIEIHNEGLDDALKMSKTDIHYIKDKSVYMDRDLALKFSEWLDSQFNIWFSKKIDSIKFSHYDAHFKALNAQQEERVVYENLCRKAAKEQNELAIQIIESHRRLESFKNDKANALRRKVKDVKYNLFNQDN